MDPQNRTLSENWVVANVTSEYETITRKEPKSSMSGVLIRGRRRDTEKDIRPCDDGDRDRSMCLPAKECQGLPVTLGAGDRHRTEVFLEPSERASPCWHLDFRQRP